MARILTALLSGALLIPWLAQAGPITFNFTGSVTQVPVDDLGTGIQSLDAITGSFTFDSAAVDAIAAPTSGSYTSNGAAFGMTVSIGAGAVTFSESGFLNIGILNSFVDQYTVTASSAALVLDLFFQDNSGAEFGSDGLPLSPPALTGFAQREFHLDQTNIAGDETQADGTITSLTCGSGCSASSVPEPSSAALLLTGAILCGLRSASRRKSKNSRTK
jgi:hypothetical protein